MSSYIKYLFVVFFGIMLFSSCSKDEPAFSDDEDVFIQRISGDYLKIDSTGNNNAVYVQNLGNNKIGFKATTGLYISYNNADSIFTASSNKIGKLETFVLTRHKQYFKLTTLNGANIVINEALQLKVSNQLEASILKIDNRFSLPDSWFSLRKISWGDFFLQLLVLIGGIYVVLKIFKNKIKTNRLSFYTVICLGFIWCYVIFNTKKWNNNTVIKSDVVFYYEYLPAALIFNDLTYGYLDNLPADYNGKTALQPPNPKTGIKISKASMGLSFMYMPFFLIGHAVAKATDYTTYGYSEPYGMWLVIGSWMYAFLALFYLRKILLHYYNDSVTVLTLIAIGLATNLFYYVTVESAMGHAFSFLLCTVFVWHTIQWHKEKSLKKTIYVGLIIGLISLIRPTNILLAMVFIFYGITGISSLKEKAKMFLKKWKYILLIFACILLVWFPQLAYWKFATGDWLHFSYGQEKFHFDNPHVFEGLFSYRKGWLVYTPLMVFAILGIGFMYKKQKEWVLPFLVFMPLNIFVVYSWWCWWYGGSFGSRPMVEIYGLMAIPLGAFIAYFDKKTTYLRSIPLFIIFLTGSLNLFQIQQYKTCLHYDSMTEEAYWQNFTTLGWTTNYQDQISPPDYEKAMKGLDEMEDEDLK